MSENTLTTQKGEGTINSFSILTKEHAVEDLPSLGFNKDKQNCTAIIITDREKQYESRLQRDTRVREKVHSSTKD